MKHLKTYESIDNSFKNYAIIKVNIYYSIIKIIRTWNERGLEKIEIMQIYQIEQSGNDIKEIEKPQKFNFSIKYIKSKILFESNDLNECLKMLPIISQTNKYNI